MSWPRPARSEVNPTSRQVCLLVRVYVSCNPNPCRIIDVFNEVHPWAPHWKKHINVPACRFRSVSQSAPDTCVCFAFHQFWGRSLIKIPIISGSCGERRLGVTALKSLSRELGGSRVRGYDGPRKTATTLRPPHASTAGALSDSGTMLARRQLCWSMWSALRNRACVWIPLFLQRALAHTNIHPTNKSLPFTWTFCFFVREGHSSHTYSRKCFS